MKKTACVLFALLLVFTSVSMALAASVSYQDGKVIVTQEEGLYQVVIDGEKTGKFVGSLMPSLTFEYPLDEGKEHLLVLLSLSGDGSIGAIESFWAGPVPERTEAPVASQPTPEATEEPAVTPAPESTLSAAREIAEPIKLVNVFYNEGVLTLTVSGLRGTGEIRIDEESVPFLVEQNGPYSVTTSLKEGDHTATLYSPDTGETISASFYAPFFPAPDLLDSASLGALLKGKNGDEIPYTVSYAGDDHGATLIITPEPEAEDLKLYLSDSLLTKLRNNSFDHVSLISGGAELSIDLKAVSPSMFSTDKAIWYYIFSITLQPNGRYRITAAAQTSMTDTVEAGFYSGITLIREGILTAVILNGIY